MHTHKGRNSYYYIPTKKRTLTNTYPQGKQLLQIHTNKGQNVYKFIPTKEAALKNTYQQGT